MTENYLPLTEYSSKYKVSISTLRRRIKANDICFKFDHGKYLILDDEAKSSSRPSLKGPNGSYMVVREGSSKSSPSPSLQASSSQVEMSHLMKSGKDFLTSSNAKNDEPILTAANKLLTELKRAYTQVLQEKEEQILYLKEELTDLKTLVRVLEAENERLSNGSRPGAFL